jgi:hypothetical protein
VGPHGGGTGGLMDYASFLVIGQIQVVVSRAL